MEPIVEVCSNWWGQQLNPSCQLWGISVLWWGRIGKLLGAAGFVALIFEILGPCRLKRWGKSLREGPVQRQLQVATKIIENTFQIMRMGSQEVLGQLLPLPPTLSNQAKGSGFISGFMATFVALLFTFGLIGIGASWVAYKWWTRWGLWDATCWQAPLFLIGMLVLTVLALIGVLAWVGISIILLPLGFALLGIGSASILRLIADALSHDQLGPFIKGATGITLFTGLFLDLLSS